LASSGIYPQSLIGTESLISAPIGSRKQQQHQRVLPSQKSSISLTPPLHRYHHSISASAVAMVSSDQSPFSLNIAKKNAISRVAQERKHSQFHTRFFSLKYFILFKNFPGHLGKKSFPGNVTFPWHLSGADFFRKWCFLFFATLLGILNFCAIVFYTLTS
jgi:hypothetical protein